MRTPHAGPCLTPTANSAYYGIAAATNGQVLATEEQLASIARIVAAVHGFHAWNVATASGRIVGHDQQAIWTARYTPRRELWGTLGRKVDPTGQRHDGRKVIDLGDMRTRVIRQLK